MINWGLITSFLELHRGQEEVEGSLFVAVHGRRTGNNEVRLKRDLLDIRRYLFTMRRVEPRLLLEVVHAPFSIGYFQDLMVEALGSLV